MNNRFLHIQIVLLMICQVHAAESLNMLVNGSFESPIIPSGGAAIPKPDVEGWNICGTYWASYAESNGGITPIPEGVNELYIYNCDVTQMPCSIIDNCTYKFSIKAAANADISGMHASFAVIEAVSPDGSRVYELDKTYFDIIDTPAAWYTFNLSYNNLPNSMLAGHGLRVRIHGSGMLNLDNAVCTATTDQIVIDDFENYNTDFQLQERWGGQAGTGISLEKECESRFLGHQSLKLQYTCTTNGSAEVEYDMKKCAFGQNLEQSLSKQLILSYCGNRINTPGGHLYIKLTDASGHAYELDSCSDLKYENWRLWIINLNDFAAGDVNTTEISKLALGIKYALNTAGSGVVYMDNIELPERKKEEFNADIRGSDGKVDMLDLAVLMQHWLVSY